MAMGSCAKVLEGFDAIYKQAVDDAHAMIRAGTSLESIYAQFLATNVVQSRALLLLESRIAELEDQATRPASAEGAPHA